MTTLNTFNYDYINIPKIDTIKILSDIIVTYLSVNLYFEPNQNTINIYRNRLQNNKFKNNNFKGNKNKKYLKTNNQKRL